jgi:putative membrane protein
MRTNPPGPTLSAMVAGAFGHMDSGWWVVMMIGMVLFWALVVVAIVWLVRNLAPGERAARREAPPMELLDRRLAEGSISVDEYEERRRILLRSRGGTEPPAPQHG